ncbi:MAG TPA: hypothetical protein VFP58_15670 [Candidatus Eisenbacteria bacterium]|nr:hypothetical protein [Candidatus Eisenbacteria bacterium]
MSAPVWQHVVAIAISAGALGWLVRRAVKGGGSKATGPCASCPASRGRGQHVAQQVGRKSLSGSPHDRAGLTQEVPLEHPRTTVRS